MSVLTRQRKLGQIDDVILWGDVLRFKELMKYGVDVNTRRKRCQKSIIHYAAMRGSLENVKFLLQCGAQIDAHDKEWFAKKKFVFNFV